MQTLRKYFYGSIATTLALYLSFAHTVSAACSDPSEYEIMAPFATLSGCVGLTEYLSKLMQTVIGVSGILAVVMIVICGIKLMTSGSAGGKSEAKDCITNAIFGVLLAIGSWLILNTINPILLKNSPLEMPTVSTTIPAPPSSAGGGVDPLPYIPGWYFRYKDTAGNIKNSARSDTQAACAAVLKAQSDAGVSIQNTPPPSATHISKSPSAPECWQVVQTGVPLDSGEQAVRQALCGNSSCVNQTPLGINGAACRYDGDPASCTNVKGLQNAAVTAIKNLQSACGCNIMITGGTEYWKHASAGTGSHAPGNGVFDLRYDSANSGLINTIKSQNPQGKASFSGNMRWLYNGFWYTDEVSAQLHGGKRHWHVCPVGASPSYCN